MGRFQSNCLIEDINSCKDTDDDGGSDQKGEFAVLPKLDLALKKFYSSLSNA